MPHAQPPDAPETNGEGSRTHELFPPVGNFNAVVPLSEIDADAEIKIVSQSPAAALAPLTTGVSPLVRAATKRRAHDETEEATLVPSRAARTSPPFRPAKRRPSWPVMITALALSLTAGLAAGVYLIKSSVPVELRAPAAMTKGDAPQDVADAAETDDAKPAQVASESRPEAKPQADTNLEASTPTADANVSEEKPSRDLNAPKRAAPSDAPSGKRESVSETAPSKSAVAERTPERHARKAATPTTDTPAPPTAVSTRRSTAVAERPPALRTPARSLPVSSPPSSAKSKRVIQWP